MLSVFTLRGVLSLFPNVHLSGQLVHGIAVQVISFNSDFGSGQTNSYVLTKCSLADDAMAHISYQPHLGLHNPHEIPAQAELLQCYIAIPHHHL